ncbi:MAG: hypothetical protein MUO64_16865 [Anaerolineales bacterium]|nr:hypothetical protein [Anaerolineales bacterium]
MLAAHIICGQVILVDSGYTLPAS